ncbi:MAG: amidohydrolase [Thermomicrobiales bacterium]|nr:amidohydrolase [Thermomicrobiales bacterium]
MPADVIYTNGTIYTIDRANPRAEAMATFRDRILAVGSADEIDALKGPETKVIDLGGRVLMPGLNDNHCHPPMYGANLQLVDATAQSVSSIAEIAERFGAAAAAAAPDAWIHGWGYDDTRVAEMRHPTRYDLDAVVGDRPAYLTRTCGHIGVASSAALRLAGITRDTPNPQGGEIDHDEQGEPTGVLRETAQQLVRSLVPPPTKDDIKRNLIVAGKKYLSMGITSWADASIRRSDELMAYQELREAGELPVRTYTMMLIHDTLDALAALGIKTGFGDEWLRIGPAKVFQDGSGGGRTAAMSFPYPDEPDNYGIQVYTQDELDDAFLRAAAAGFQCCAHAIGDRAIEMIIDAMDKALQAHPQEDARWRIEHCGLLRDDLLDRMVELKLIAVPQPSFIHYLGDSYIRNFSRQTLELSYPTRDWLDRGILAIGSSDAPVTPAEPWVGIRAAVTRLTLDGDKMGPEQGVSVAEALEMYTINGARGSFEEAIKGTLVAGKLADAIVLDRDPFSVDPEQLHEVQVDMTMSGGNIVFER